MIAALGVFCHAGAIKLLGRFSSAVRQHSALAYGYYALLPGFLRSCSYPALSLAVFQYPSISYALGFACGLNSMPEAVAYCALVS